MTTAKLFATWFGAGLLKPAPGTWGSLAALPFAFLLLHYGGWPVLLLAAIAVFAIGVHYSRQYADEIGQTDPGSIVIDEVAGQWLALLPAALTPLSFLAGFALFRLFDIWKPWPIRRVERTLKGGLGIMADDVLAGLFAAIVLLLLQRLTGVF
jgi:phosphatidylglycerophosphatase A